MKIKKGDLDLLRESGTNEDNLNHLEDNRRNIGSHL